MMKARHGFEIEGQVAAWMLALLVSGAGCGVVLEPIEDGESAGGGQVEGGASPIDPVGNCDSGGWSQGGDSAGGWSQGGGGLVGPQCYDESSAEVLRPGLFSGVEIHQGECTASQISELYPACVDVATPGDCELWTALAPENETCFQCAIAPVGPPEALPALLGGDGGPYLSVYACAAHLLGLPQCAVPFQSRVLCAFTACAQCDNDSDEQSVCQNWAINQSPVCSAIALPAECTSLYELESLPAECIGNAFTLEQAFPILANLYCGAP